MQARTESFLQVSRLVTWQTELAQSNKARHKKHTVLVVSLATPSTIFSTMYSSMGLVNLLCMGKQGSKWVMGRQGKQEERSLFCLAYITKFL